MRKLMSGAAITMALAVSCASVKAEDGCDGIDWSVKREQSWFKSKKLADRDSGARLRRINRAVELKLKPLKQAQFFLPPAARPREGSYAGEIAYLGVPRPGAYVVTLSRPGHVDVFENGVRLKAEATAHARNCGDVSVSARYDLQRGDLVLVQVSDVASDAIKLAFSTAP